MRTRTLALVCFPYYPSKHTGRGHDRYVFELCENIRASSDDFVLTVVEQGLSKGVLAAGTKLSKLVVDLMSTKADVYHAISPVGGAIAALLGKSPLVVTVHDLIPFYVSGYDYAWKHSYLRACIRTCVARAAAVIVPYHVTKAQLVSLLMADPSKIHVVHYGVDHAYYHPRLALERAARRILYIGEVSRSKGVDVLIRAFATVKRSVPDAELLIGGKPSKDQSELEALCQSLGTRDVTFRGFIAEDDLAEHYSTATLMVFPSRYGFGLSTLEAMACGAPVLVAAALDAPEFIADAGIIVKPDDPDDLAQGIVRVLTEPGLRQDLGARATERAKLFAWSEMARETRVVYDGLLAGKRAMSGTEAT
jgi:glycosyltransferase involved in cell wall biosynthesis